MVTDQEYKQLRYDLVRYLMRLGVFARKHAEDVAQESLILLFLRLQDPMAETLRDTTAWLRSIAHHRLTRLHVLESRSLPLSETLESEGHGWVGPYFIDYINPERTYMAKEELATLREYIDPREYAGDELPSDFYRKRLERFRKARKSNGPDPS